MKTLIIIFVVAVICICVACIVLAIGDGTAQAEESRRREKQERTAECLRLAQQREMFNAMQKTIEATAYKVGAQYGAQRAQTQAQRPAPQIAPMMVVPYQVPQPQNVQNIQIAQQPGKKCNDPILAIAFPKENEPQTENAVFPAEWRQSRSELLQYAESLGVRRVTVSATEEDFVIGGKTAIRCFFVPNDYPENLRATNAMREICASPLLNVNSPDRLNMAKAALKKAAH